MLVEESQVVVFLIGYIQKELLCKKGWTLYRKTELFWAIVRLFDSDSKTVLFSTQDSRWIVMFKYNDGVLYFMFFYSLVVTQSLRIHNPML